MNNSDVIVKHHGATPTLFSTRAHRVRRFSRHPLPVRCAAASLRRTTGIKRKPEHALRARLASDVRPRGAAVRAEHPHLALDEQHRAVPPHEHARREPRAVIFARRTTRRGGGGRQLERVDLDRVAQFGAVGGRLRRVPSCQKKIKNRVRGQWCEKARRGGGPGS